MQSYPLFPSFGPRTFERLEVQPGVGPLAQAGYSVVDSKTGRFLVFFFFFQV